MPKKKASKDRKIEEKLDKILAVEKRILRKEAEIESREEEIEALEKIDNLEEKKLEALEKEELKELRIVEARQKSELDELTKLERLEQEIKTEVGPHPLRKLTYHDFVKAVIGAFFGIVGHFAFIYGTHIAEDISMARATALYVISFLIAVGFLYFSGFRKVKEYRALRFIPLRVITIYVVSLLVVIGVLYIFGYIEGSLGFEKIYKEVGAISILAILGACAADLVGRE